MKIKNIIVGSIILLVLFSLQTLGQIPEIKTRRFENFIFIGPSFGLLRGSEFDTGSEKYQRTKFGYTVGMGTNYQVSEPFDLSAQIMMENKGSKWYYSYNAGQNKEETEFTFHNFTLVLLPVFRICSNRKFGVGSGPFVSYMHKLELDQYSQNPPQYFKMDATEFLRDWEFGLSFQCNYRFNVNDNFHLSLKLLNQLGLTNINNTETSLAYGEAKTNATSILIECTFR